MYSFSLAYQTAHLDRRTGQISLNWSASLFRGPFRGEPAEGAVQWCAEPPEALRDVELQAQTELNLPRLEA